MNTWDVIAKEAENLSRELRREAVDLAEAEKAGDYFIGHDFDEESMRHYLQLLADKPPQRSKRSIRHYRALRSIWHNWKPALEGKDKARAWGWAVRLAKVDV